MLVGVFGTPFSSSPGVVSAEYFPESLNSFLVRAGVVGSASGFWGGGSTTKHAQMSSGECTEEWGHKHGVGKPKHLRRSLGTVRERAGGATQ
jgi:hypothetical protein